MHQENLKFLYREYKNCMKNEFAEYLGKDDSYKSYIDKCYNQKNDIFQYYHNSFIKMFKLSPTREEKEVNNNYEKNYKLFSEYGWTGPQVKN
jgi:hypothetical protein